MILAQPAMGNDVDLSGKKVTIMGLGHHGGGVSAARFCAQAGAVVTITDLRDEKQLSEPVALLPGIPFKNFRLGHHREEDFHFADIVVVNPAVRPSNRFVEVARQAGARILSEIELFLARCPATVIGVTGTVGKSTTSAMLAAVLKSAGRRTWLGGNIGQSLLSELPQITPTDIVVLELSSFQLHWLSDDARWPRGAIITNCSPNHLDWHGSWEHYVASKQRLLSHLPTDGFCVLDTASPEVCRWQGLERGREVPLCHFVIPKLAIPGLHNRSNAACAATVAAFLGIDEATVAHALGQFSGLPHRMQFLGKKLGRFFFNDSKSTSPAATLAALNCFERRSWFLLGGSDANADFAELSNKLVSVANGSAVFGAAAEKLVMSIYACNPEFLCHHAISLPEAFAWCIEKSEPSDTILLSPACPSTDQFRDFAHRGDEFDRLVRSIDTR